VLLELLPQQGVEIQLSLQRQDDHGPRWYPGVADRMLRSPAVMMQSEPGAARRLAALTLAALALRLLFVLVEPSTHPVGDERTWTNWAVENLVTPRVSFSPFRTHMIFYPPLYPYFIAAPFAAFGTLSAVKVVQAAVGALLVGALGLVGGRLMGARAGWIAASLAAFYPELVWFSAHFWSETLFLVLLWWSFERLYAADARGSSSVAAAAGLLWGLAILTRETTLYFTPVAAAWLAWPRGPRVRAGAVFLIVSLATVAPWTYRNWRVFHAFVPVSTAGGQNLFQGNTSIPRDETYRMVDAVDGRIAQYHYAMAMGIQAIRDRQPWWALEKLREQMPNFWEADSLALIHVKRGAYGEVSPAAACVAAVVVLAPYLLLLPLFALGLAMAVLARDRRLALLVLFLVYYNALHVITHGFARYRLPVMPLVFLLAGWAWTERRGLAGLPRRPVLATAGALLLILALCVTPSLRRNLEHPAFGLPGAGAQPVQDGGE
jgi:hypothetical protein